MWVHFLDQKPLSIRDMLFNLFKPKSNYLFDIESQQYYTNDDVWNYDYDSDYDCYYDSDENV